MARRFDLDRRTFLRGAGAGALLGAAGVRPVGASTPLASFAGEHQVFEHAEKEFSALWLMVVITAGGLVSGFLVYTFAPEAEGHGTDAAIDSFHNNRGQIRTRIPIIKTRPQSRLIVRRAGGEGPL